MAFQVQVKPGSTRKRKSHQRTCGSIGDSKPACWSIHVRRKYRSVEEGTETREKPGLESMGIYTSEGDREPKFARGGQSRLSEKSDDV